jgi:F-box/WD-40 domain protein 7
VLPQVLEGHTRPVLSLAWSATHLFSGSYDHTIRVWDLNTLAKVTILSGALNCLLNTRLQPLHCSCTVEERVAERWLCHAQATKTLSARLRWRARNSSAAATTIRWGFGTPQRSRALALLTGTLVRKFLGRVWAPLRCPCRAHVLREARTNHLRAERYLGSFLRAGPVRTLAVACGRVFSGSYDKTVRAWDVDTLQCLGVLEGHKARSSAACSSRVLQPLSRKQNRHSHHGAQSFPLPRPSSLPPLRPFQHAH